MEDPGASLGEACYRESGGQPRRGVLIVPHTEKVRNDAFSGVGYKMRQAAASERSINNPLCVRLKSAALYIPQSLYLFIAVR